MRQSADWRAICSLGFSTRQPAVDMGGASLYRVLYPLRIVVLPLSCMRLVQFTVALFVPVRCLTHSVPVRRLTRSLSLSTASLVSVPVRRLTRLYPCPPPHSSLSLSAVSLNPVPVRRLTRSLSLSTASLVSVPVPVRRLTRSLSLSTASLVSVPVRRLTRLCPCLPSHPVSVPVPVRGINRSLSGLTAKDLSRWRISLPMNELAMCRAMWSNSQNCVYVCY